MKQEDQVADSVQSSRNAIAASTDTSGGLSSRVKSTRDSNRYEFLMNQRARKTIDKISSAR